MREKEIERKCERGRETEETQGPSGNGSADGERRKEGVSKGQTANMTGVMTVTEMSCAALCDLDVVHPVKY